MKKGSLEEKIPHSNCFDLLRLGLAGLVIFSHSWLLGGFGEESFKLWNRNQAICGEIAVLGFFALSGYLITASYERSKNLMTFLLRRVRRIFPGFLVCLLVTAFIIAPVLWAEQHRFMGEFPWIGEESSWSYVWKNAVLLMNQPCIRGTLDQVIYPASINGSLWSLAPEGLCYLGLGILGVAGILVKHRPLLFLITAMGYLFYVLDLVLPEQGNSLLPVPVVLSSLTAYPLAFCIGACCYLARDLIGTGWRPAVLSTLVCILLLKFGGFQLASPLWVSLAIIYWGRAFTLPLKNDYSYGLYIYGFPLQQVLAALSLPRAGFMIFFACSLIAAFFAAVLSWHFVEKPCLQRSNS